MDAMRFTSVAAIVFLNQAPSSADEPSDDILRRPDPGWRTIGACDCGGKMNNRPSQDHANGIAAVLRHGLGSVA